MEQATGGYRPRFADSALAVAALSEDFIQGFKQSLLSDYQNLATRGDFTFYSLTTSSQSIAQRSLDDESTTNDSPTTGTASSIGAQGSTMGCSDIAYPLSLFDCFPELPSTDTMEGLTRVFRDAFLKNTPFLSSISQDSVLASASGNPSYLVFSKTLLATLFSESHHRRRWASNLYISGVKTFVGAVELDNRTSRNHLWYQAGILLVAYGMLQSNPTVWHTINMLNGYFLAPYKRSGLLQIGPLELTPAHRDLALLTSFYFLVDLLRAIHMNTPPSIDPSHLSFPIHGSDGLDFETLYHYIIFLHRPLQDHLNSDVHLLGLLCILSETMLLLRFLGPLADRKTEVSRKSIDEQIQMLAQYPLTARGARHNDPPSAASREYLQQVESLKKSLTTWHHSVHSPEPRIVTEHENPWIAELPSEETSHVDRGILALAYFCRILLEVGPRVLTLPQMAGYPRNTFAETGDTAFSNQSWDDSIQVSDIALECAWKILDACDSYDGVESHVDGINRPLYEKLLPPIWLPLVVFYSSLIVWRRIWDDHNKRMSGGPLNSLSARRRIIKDFVNALRRMENKFECATCMADTVQNLRL